MRNKKVFILIILAAIIFSGIQPVLAVSVEDIRAEIKCPDHDRPEIVSLVNSLIKEGKAKDEILDAVAEQFGEGVLVVTREKRMGFKPYVIPVIGLTIAFVLVFVYIKKWITKGEKTNLRDKEIVEASKDITDYNKRFNEEFEIFKKED
ncbi:MAG: cytochrome c-type biogenesis protein CcmH [bacterium]|nr:cytochrome c-type biogenesis protein CcmH [bacterium]